MQPYLPLGTLYAATALRGSGISVSVFDAMLSHPETGFAELMSEEMPRIAVVYEDDFNFLSKMCLTRMREVAWFMAGEARKHGAVTIIHGSDSTDNPEEFLANGFDYVLCGEAEQALIELCTAILQKSEIPALDGLIRKDKQGHLVRSNHGLAKNPDWVELPLPSRELVSLTPYRDAWTKAHGYFSTNMVASRGCPFRCNWCAKPISGNRFQQREAGAVAGEMSLLKQAGAEHIWFGDDVFALNRHWVKDFAMEVTKRHAALPFKVQSRADLMHEDTVKNLKIAGCDEVWMGVESGSQSILDAMDKGITLEQVTTARQRLKSEGIRACFFLQFGYPGETWKELQETIALVRKLRPDDIGISFSYPLPGTPFFYRVQEHLGEKRNWRDSDDLCIMFKAAYTTEFYRAVREALHAEVDSWTSSQINKSERDARALWEKVEEMEPDERVVDAFQFAPSTDDKSSASFIPLTSLITSTKICESNG
jgi:anaerobic magnesium-protoporphyrin IX monomethyl ester cyclase